MCNSVHIKFIIIPLVFALTLANYGQVAKLRVFVDGKELSSTIQAERRGTQLLIPVVSVARELGFLVEVNTPDEEISIRRGGVEARFLKRTSEVRENGISVLSVPNTGEIVFTQNAEDLLLPGTVVSALMNVSVFAEIDNLLVRIEKHETTASNAVTKEDKWSVKGLDYNYDSSYSNGYFTQNLNLVSAGTIGSNNFQSNLSLGGGVFGMPISFRQGNFTLERRQGDKFQFGDLNLGVASDLTFARTQIRGAAYETDINMLGRAAKYMVFGGRAYSGFTEPQLNVDNFDNRRRFRQVNLDTTIYGGRISFIPGTVPNKTILTNNFSYSFGAIGFKGRGLSGQIADGSVGYRSTRLNFRVEGGVGNFNILNSDNRQTSKGLGAGVVFNGSFTSWKILTIQGRFEKFTPNFSGPKRSSNYNNRSGYNINFIANPLRTLSLGGGFSNSNYLGFSRTTNKQATNNTKSFYYTAAYDPPTRFLPRMSYSSTTIRSSVFGEISTKRINLAREFKNFRPYINFTQTSRKGSDGNQNISLGTSFSAGSFGRFQTQGSLSLGKSPILTTAENCALIGEESVSGTCLLPADRRLSLSSSSMTVNWSPNRSIYKDWNINLGGGYAKNYEETRILFNAASNVPLPYGQKLQLSYYNSGYGHEIRIGLSGSLAFWRSKEARNVSVTDEDLLTDGAIQGQIYLDENFNRIFDKGTDAPLSNVRVQLDNGRVVVSDESGNYRFERVEPGTHRLTMNIEDIRAELVPISGAEQTLTVKSGATVETSFRLVKSGTLSGRVWNDGNSNGVFDAGEGLADVRVVSSSGRDTYTDIDGSYLLSELPPGEQVIFIDERYKAENLTTKILNRQAQVKSGQETKDVYFIFKVKQQEVEEKIFGAN